MPISLTRTPSSKAAELARHRAECVAEVNDAVGQARLPYVTNIPGQEMIYNAKEREALAYLAMDPKPADLSEFPFMEAEVGVSADTPLELAQLWQTTAAQWRVVGPTFEELRLSAIRDLKAAVTMGEIDIAMETFRLALGAQTSPINAP
ncbi:hypothetical protein PXK56_17970 [Phaeobacter gallaeciensis]|uniref:hypothetical protein n=1 Tax=Phaeobacter gallaeciensis TaxID=60890 RepID=UPI00238008D6|nr:hypothetical protein [Phaeobacter gallaeciensis]MDE4297077.1 hypothetical protein [Phaeobacter gallaeciensis]